MKKIISDRFTENIAVTTATLTHLGSKIAQAAEMMVQCYRRGGGIFVFGNGGSASDAQHIAGELVGRFLRERKALRAEALSTNTSILTAVGNDYGFDRIFARQLEANARRGDMAFGLSTSGNSPNVVAALEYARANGIGTIALTGRGGGKCASLADVLLDVPADLTPRVQEAGTVVYHILCELVETAMCES